MPYSLSRVVVGVLAAVLFAAVLAACSQQPESEPPQAPTPSAPAPAFPTPAPAAAPTVMPSSPAATSAPAAQPTATSAPQPAATEPPAPAPAASSAGPVENTFVLAEGTIARYKVEEELAGRGFFVATGETTDVAGSIAFDADGGIVSEQSRIVMQAATLMTDSDRRDRYVRERTLSTSEYPEIAFVPTSADGLPSPLSEASGTVEFTISGDLTVRDQTRPVTWDVVAEFGDTISGLASVVVSFEQFGMNKPSVAVVLSVEDTFLLELEFVGAFDEASAVNTDSDSEPADTAPTVVAAAASAANTDAEPADTAPAEVETASEDTDDEAAETTAAVSADIADEAFAHVLGDPDAPVTVVEFSDFQ